MGGFEIGGGGRSGGRTLGMLAAKETVASYQERDRAEETDFREPWVWGHTRSRKGDG